MASVWGELKRRNVVKVAVAYAIVGWLSVEIAATVLPIFVAPDWILQVFTFFVILGFPLALILSWAYELTPEGASATVNIEPVMHIKSSGRDKFWAASKARGISSIISIGFPNFTK